MTTDLSIQEQIDLLARGTEAIYTTEDLEARLKSAAEAGRQLRVKLGMDPTAPDIHLGHTVVLRKLRQFQDLGHRAVLIIGDYTARVGDPSGANKTRPMLTPEEIEANAKTYFEQAGKILNISPEACEIRYNSEWLGDLSFGEVIQLCSQMTVARMMERDTFELRYRDGVPIGVHEFLYPLIQGYDSVCVEADVELGGTDQTFNNLVGRQLQEQADQPPQIVMIFPLLVGLDGVQKMSKSKGNYIGINDEPNDMFGKVMSIPDELMENYFLLATEVARERIDELTDPDKTHPRDAKVTLAREVVRTYHGQEAADAAEQEFTRVFAQGQTPDEMPEIVVQESAMGIRQLVKHANFAASSGEAKRLIKQNAVSIDDEKISDPNAEIALETGQILRVGKRRFGRIVVK
jgi:tyrosyl-tRNA synthetase